MFGSRRYRRVPRKRSRSRLPCDGPEHTLDCFPEEVADERPEYPTLQPLNRESDYSADTTEQEPEIVYRTFRCLHGTPESIFQGEP
jgi:hypothetical protein